MTLPGDPGPNPTLGLSSPQVGTTGHPNLPGQLPTHGHGPSLLSQGAPLEGGEGKNVTGTFP